MGFFKKNYNKSISYNSNSNIYGFIIINNIDIIIGSGDKNIKVFYINNEILIKDIIDENNK